MTLRQFTRTVLGAGCLRRGTARVLTGLAELVGRSAESQKSRASETPGATARLRPADGRAAGLSWLLLVAACAAGGCAPPVDSTAGAPPSGGGAAVPGPAAGEWFTDGAAAAGLDFVHFNGMSGDFHQTEIMGPGLALFDYDNDGDLDLYVAQGRTLGSGQPLMPSPGPLADRLYRNDLEASPDGPRLRFTDVTAESGLSPGGHGMGAAAGDLHSELLKIMPA